jgi:hypothetical protein
MRSERGQASVEWIGLVLLVALVLTALARLAPRADAGDLGAELAHALTCAASGGCDAERSAPARSGNGRLVVVPPLVPVSRGERRSSREGSPRRVPRGRAWPRPARSAGPLLQRAGRGAGRLWRRSWLLCLGYERVRWSVLHPEIRFPHQTIPISEDLRIANDCLSPVDLVRDRDLLRGGP